MASYYRCRRFNGNVPINVYTQFTHVLFTILKYDETARSNVCVNLTNAPLQVIIYFVELFMKFGNIIFIRMFMKLQSD